MKVLVYLNLSRIFLEKNEISKLHEEWKISPSGKVQNIGEETLKGLFSNLIIPTVHLLGLLWSILAGWL
jgi:hypothetical protein